MNEPIVVDVGWYRLVVDPEKVLINMNLRDFKKMLRICCNVLEDYSSRKLYLKKWEYFLYWSGNSNKDPLRRSKFCAAVQERRNKL